MKVGEYKMKKSYSVPVVVIVFNRVKLAEKMLNCLKKIEPQILFVISDGARKDVAGEQEKVAQVRALFDRISWDCKVYREYADENMGCDSRVPTGISRAFAYVDRAVILEDDCIPSMDFFRYAEEMLKKYQDCPEVMMISGSNLLKKYEIPYSCCFTARTYTWGWATWKRAWDHYCEEEAEWNRIQRDGTLSGIYPLRTRYYVKKELNYYIKRGGCPWDYRWWISCMGAGGLCAVPRVNLITNEGFGEDATHTQEKGNYTGITCPMDFPLILPEKVERDRAFDRYDSGLNPPWKIVRAYHKLFRHVRRFLEK